MIAHVVLVDSQSIQRVAVPEILPLVSLRRHESVAHALIVPSGRLADQSHVKQVTRRAPIEQSMQFACGDIVRIGGQNVLRAVGT